MDQRRVPHPQQSQSRRAKIKLANRRNGSNQRLDLHDQPPRIQRILRRVHQQYSDRLGERMMQVVALIAEGFSLKEIAFIMGIDHHTVEFHWAKAKQKLGFRSYVDTVRYSIKHGLVTL